jgi:hypothetical protein
MPEKAKIPGSFKRRNSSQLEVLSEDLAKLPV